MHACEIWGRAERVEEEGKKGRRGGWWSWRNGDLEYGEERNDPGFHAVKAWKMRGGGLMINV